jgi:uncharacterized protein YciI
MNVRSNNNERTFFYIFVKTIIFMKRFFYLLFAAFCFLYFFAGNSQAQTNPVKNWQMKTYYMVILKTGPNRNQDSIITARIQATHLANIGKLYDDKKLVLAGPFIDDSPLAGIFIFDVATQEEADKLASADPAVIAGRLIYEIHPWYGPSTLHF